MDVEPTEGETAEIGLSGTVFGKFHTCGSGAGYRGPLRQDRTIVLIRDEVVKIPLGRRGCSRMITGSGFGELRLPQDLGSGRRKQGHPTSLGFHGERQKRRKDDS